MYVYVYEHEDVYGNGARRASTERMAREEAMELGSSRYPQIPLVPPLCGERFIIHGHRSCGAHSNLVV